MKRQERRQGTGKERQGKEEIEGVRIVMTLFLPPPLSLFILKKRIFCSYLVEEADKTVATLGDGEALGQARAQQLRHNGVDALPRAAVGAQPPAPAPMCHVRGQPFAHGRIIMILCCPS